MRMTTEQHIWACALEFERQHGDAALSLASQRAAELETQGALEGARTWRTIAVHLERLRTQPEQALQ